jgi:hypothetical protein
MQRFQRGQSRCRPGKQPNPENANLAQKHENEHENEHEHDSQSGKATDS